MTGLSHAEALVRNSDNRREARLAAEKQVQNDQLKRRIFSIFNLTMLVLAVTQVFLQDVWGALGTLGALILNITISVFHQVRSARQVGKLLFAARPTATVLREGQLSNIDQDDVVPGDLVVVGKGDEIIAEGIVLESSNLSIDLSPLDSSGTIKEKFDGDKLPLGGYCETGWAIYRVEQLPDEVDADEISMTATPIAEVRTPLQKGVNAMLLVLLSIAAVFYGILIIEVLRLEYFPSDLVLIYRQAISIVFSIAPAGLLFMVIINYAVGSANIAKAGALIRSSHTIELLAQITSLILVRKRNLDSLSAQIDNLPGDNGESAFSESRTRQLLGNYFHSVPSDQFPFSILKENLEGDRYRLKREARFFSVLGWEAVNFDSEDMPGTYVLGYPEILQAYLEDPDALVAVEPQLESIPEPVTGIKGKLSHLWSKIRTRKNQEQPSINKDSLERVGSASANNPSIWQKLRSRFENRVEQPQAASTQAVSETSEEEMGPVMRLLFAYSPGILPATSTTPRPPGELIPVCYLNIVKSYRPEMKASLQGVRDVGVSLKIFSSGNIHNAAGLAKELGLEDEGLLPAQIITGDVLTEKIANEELETIKEKTVFYQHSTTQMIQVIDVLRGEGQVVAVQSSAIADIPLMSHADVNISVQSSSNKVLARSDVILMDNSPSTLPVILKMGQNMIQSVVNLLKINLAEIGYVLLLIIAMFLIGSRRFIYEPIHGGIIGIVTITLPSVFISLWTNTLKAERLKIRRQLGMFIIPTSITITLVAIATYFLFSGRGYLFFRIQHIITHLLIMVGLLLVVFCYPPIRMLSWNDQIVSDPRMTGVALILFALFHAVTFLPLFQRTFRLSPLIAITDYLLIWAIGLGWGFVTLVLWRVGWRWFGKQS